MEGRRCPGSSCRLFTISTSRFTTGTSRGLWGRAKAESDEITDITKITIPQKMENANSHVFSVKTKAHGWAIRGLLGENQLAVGAFVLPVKLDDQVHVHLERHVFGHRQRVDLGRQLGGVPLEPGRDVVARVGFHVLA